MAIHQLGYGGSANHYDEYLRVAETTGVFKFCRCVIDVFGSYYLRILNTIDVERLHQMQKQIHDFLGMLGSLDYMH